MKEAIKAMEKSTNECMKALLAMLADEEGLTKENLAIVGMLSELIDATFRVEYSMAEELEEIKSLVMKK